MGPQNRPSTSVSSDGTVQSLPSEKPKPTFQFSEGTGGPSKRELELEVTRLQALIRELTALNKEEKATKNEQEARNIRTPTAENKEQKATNNELEAQIRTLTAENKELMRQLSIAQQAQHTIDVNQTRSGPVGGDQYKIKILGTIGERIYTGSDVKGQDGELLKAVIYCNNNKVTWDPFASADFEVVVVHGDFCVNDQKSWSVEEFEQNLVKARKEVGVIFSGVYRSKFSNGERDLHGLKFKDNSSWADGKKWRLGVRVLGSSTVRILEAISEPFRVLDRRGKVAGKLHPPMLTNGVECLERVGHKRALMLKNNGIHTVGQFWQHYQKRPKNLLQILSIKSDSDESWIAMTRHAKEGVAGPNHYSYAGPSTNDGQADVQDVHTRYPGNDACISNSNQLMDTETDADQYVGLNHCTVQHYELIQGFSCINMTISLLLVLMLGQLPDTESDADQNARPDHNLGQHYNFIQDETSIQEVEQEGSFFPKMSTTQPTLAHENLFGSFAPYNENGFVEEILLNEDAHMNSWPNNYEAEFQQWIDVEIDSTPADVSQYRQQI